MSEHGASGDIAIGLREFLYANHECVEGIGAIGASLQLVLLGLCQFLSSLILLAIIHTSKADGYEQIFIVLAVDHGTVLSLAHEHTVDEQHLLQVSHRVAQIDLVDIPAMVCEIVGDEGMEVIIHQGVVVAHEGRVVVEVNLLASLVLVILHELIE